MPVITAGAIIAMILLRRKIADGTARASEVAEFDRLTAERSTGVDEAMADAIDALIAHREREAPHQRHVQPAVPLGGRCPRAWVRARRLPRRQHVVHRWRHQGRATAAGLPRGDLRHVRVVAGTGVPVLFDAGVEHRLPGLFGEPVPHRSVGARAAARRAGRAACSTPRAAWSKGAPLSSTSRSRAGGAASSPATR